MAKIIASDSNAETYDQRQERFRAIRESIVSEMQAANPEATFERNKNGVNLIYYVAWFNDGIQVQRRTRSIHAKAFSLKPYFLTEVAAKNAIGQHVDSARKKFQNCLAQLMELQASLGFEVSYFVCGDTHGLEHSSYIEFTMEGFQFTFTID